MNHEVCIRSDSEATKVHCNVLILILNKIRLNLKKIFILPTLKYDKAYNKSINDINL